MDDKNVGSFHYYGTNERAEKGYYPLESHGYERLSFTEDGHRYLIFPSTVTIISAVEKGYGGISYAISSDADTNKKGSFSTQKVPFKVHAGSVVRVSSRSVDTYKAVLLEWIRK